MEGQLMKRIPIPPYGCILHVTDNFKEWARAYERLSPYVAESGSSGLTYDNQDGNYYVGIFKHDLNTTVHELAHVCLMIAGRVQLGDIVKEQEQFCYLIGWLTQQVLKAYPQFKGE
ncbi:hypothetical protein D3C72_1359710 [compost metagenome]